MAVAKELAREFERAVAVGRLDKELVAGLAEQVDRLDFHPGKIDWCIYGICIDWLIPTDRITDFVTQLMPGLGVSDRLDWHIYGVPRIDLVKVQVVRDARTAESPGLEQGFL
jgi:hypothetical protein